jgi:hypothetical protein
LLHPHQRQIADSENKDNNDIHKNMETNIKTNLNKQIPRTEQSLDNNRDQTLEMAISILIMTGIREYESRFANAQHSNSNCTTSKILIKDKPIHNPIAPPTSEANC